MNHFADQNFWKAYHSLPKHIQLKANACFERLRDNPKHPSLRLKRVGKLWSVRIGRRYRALGLSRDGDIYWFWIGSHAEYDQIL